VRGRPRQALPCSGWQRAQVEFSNQIKCPRNFNCRARRACIRCCRDTDARSVAFCTLLSRLNPVMIRYALIANEFIRQFTACLTDQLSLPYKKTDVIRLSNSLCFVVILTVCDRQMCSSFQKLDHAIACLHFKSSSKQATTEPK